MIASFTLACGSVPLALVSSPEAAAGDDVRELVAEAHALERELERLGLVVHEHRALGAYLQSVGERVAAHGRGLGSVRPRIAILYDPSANALALANGTIYVHTGLLARLENEAQLAQVLAHELGHVGRRHRKDSPRPLARGGGRAFRGMPAADAAITASLGAAGSSMLADFPRREPAGGLVREHEADLDALRAMASAGYRSAEATRLYALLDDEAEGYDRPRSLDTHPPTAERTQAMEAARRGVAPGSAIHATAYLGATREIVLRNVRLCLERRLYRRALEEVGRSRRLRGHDSRLDALEAEARRRLAANTEETPRGSARRHGAAAPAGFPHVGGPTALLPFGARRGPERPGTPAGEVVMARAPRTPR